MRSETAGRESTELSRGSFLKLGALATAGLALPALAGRAEAQAVDGAFVLEEATISGLQEALSSGQLTSVDLVRLYLDRISILDVIGVSLGSVLELNPEAGTIAAALDEERLTSGARGPLHGIPVLLKDNIDTADATTTTAGSLALEGSVPLRDATVVEKLRASGAVILGKANMSEWANFRSSESSSGWSSRGGQGLNPYALDRSPCGSSSGSASAVAANLVAASLGTETDGSILCPAAFNGVVGIKPTVGLLSHAGVIPIAESQDTIGPVTRTVSDAAVLLGALTGIDSRDEATRESGGKLYTDYTRFLDAEGLRGARIGVARAVYFGYSEETDRLAQAAIEEIGALGAVVIDPADIPTAAELQSSEAEFTVLLYEFKAGLNEYLASLGPGAPVKNLEEVIAFNERNADRVMPYFGQDILEMAQEKGPLTDDEYREALEESRRLSREEGIDAVMDEYGLDALISPTTGPAFKIDLVNGDNILGSSSQPTAMAGYPALTVPMGEAFGLPVGLTFMGRAYSEPTLLKLAYAFEQATGHRRAPRLSPTAAEELPRTGGGPPPASL